MERSHGTYAGHFLAFGLIWFGHRVVEVFFVGLGYLVGGGRSLVLVIRFFRSGHKSRIVSRNDRKHTSTLYLL